MEPSPVRPSTGYLSYLITGLKNPDVEVPDKCVFELPVSVLQVLMSLVACGEACGGGQGFWWGFNP